MNKSDVEKDALIAELLAALKGALKLIETMDVRPAGAVALIRAAIAKAESAK